ncbi:MAG: hypothetical protein QS2022_2350 [Candidatus Phytoplasma asteris]|uniref:Uncharacterized protein n=1 Tax='Chrysanthemum coronarium' phytoplasma TaxID=1520703 RepID=A0ABQ0J326_9MOLU|nr:hypothetical protein ['Chrysanthemum coronarium' phytoplasma]TKA88014.1 MAG: hypothetical protein PLY_2340 [Periwinkle leaf yellowing phytoplasma]WEX19511.1 MAG: hypothetical protein QS2022_2350 [Candidatus Phytoplasma asteris]GAK74003.1 uncharacterized protein OYV_04890 ['Chrysanthemum coronarium' phytoplasma]
MGCIFGYDKTQKIRIKQRYFTSEGKVNWQDEDSWDREFDELGRIIKSIIYTSDSNSKEDKQVNWDSDYTYYCFYDQQGKQLHSVTRNRHYKLENGKIQVDWASEKTFDQKFNDDGSRNMRYFTQDDKINWENENTCNYDAIGNTQNLEGTQISSQERELEDKLQVYKKEDYNYVLEIDIPQLVDKVDLTQEDNKTTNVLLQDAVKVLFEKTAYQLVDFEYLFTSQIKQMVQNEDIKDLLQLLTTQINKLNVDKIQNQEKIQTKLQSTNISMPLTQTIKQLAQDVVINVLNWNKDQLQLNDNQITKVKNAISDLFEVFQKFRHFFVF